MAARSRVWSLLVQSLFALACGGAEQGRLCDRLGQLCIASNVDLRRSIGGSSNASADLDGDSDLDVLFVTAEPAELRGADQ